MTPPWTVVKVGGSLFDWPKLPERLQMFVRSLGVANVLLVPGGGATADAIRAFDQTHTLGEETSHWLAIRALSVNAHFLHAILPGATIGDPEPCASSHVVVLDAYPFFLEDEKRPDHLPHRWDVTSDALAARAACLVGASELILLKSTSWQGADWRNAIETGVVDGYFAVALQQAKQPLRVRVVNLRASED